MARKATVRVSKTAKTVEGLTFDQKAEGLAETFGVSTRIYQKIQHRLKAWAEEEMRESADLLLAQFGSKQKVKDYLASIEDESDEDKARALRKFGMKVTKTEDMEAFLKSELFKSIGWKPTSPNDYLLLGWIFGGHFAHKSLEQVLSSFSNSDIIKKLLG